MKKQIHNPCSLHDNEDLQKIMDLHVRDLDFRLQSAVCQYSELSQLGPVRPMTSKAYTLGTFAVAPPEA